MIYTPVGLPRWCSVTVQKLPANVGDERHAVRSLGQKDPMEKEMAPQVSILDWRISWTEEPGRLQSMG